jgi:hypothetical protein
MGYPNEIEEEEDFRPVVENADGTADVDLDAPHAPADDEGGSWRSRKRMRYDEAVKERDEALAAIENERKARLELEDRVNKFQREASEFASTIEPQADPDDDALDELDTERDNIQKEWAALNPTQAPELRASFQKRLRMNEQRRMEIQAERVLEKHEQRRGTADPLITYKKQVLEGDFPDIAGNKAAFAYADGYWKQQRAKGRNDGIELFKEALETAREEFKTAPRKGPGGKPTEAQRAKYAGQGKGAGGGAAPNGRFRMSKEMVEMADIAYDHIDDPDVRRQTWAREVGSKMKKS